LLKINGIEFIPNPEIPKYPNNYVNLFQTAQYNDDMEARTDQGSGNRWQIGTMRELCKKDLWFLLHFVMGYKDAHHPFVVKQCMDIQGSTDDDWLDLWARGHFKSSIITKARTIQMILNDPEQRIAIFSHTRPAAKSFLREIKTTLQQNEVLIACFPDVLYKNAEGEALKWSEDDGCIVKRKGTYAEATLEAWGLLEGMPTGKHFTHRIYDDIETKDLVENPDTIRRLIDAFKVSMNLTSKGGTHRVIGTPYHHEGVLQYIRMMKTLDGKEMYQTRIVPATDNGLPSGKAVYLSDKELDKLKTDEYTFNCQQLLNPTPVGTQKLNSSYLKEMEEQFIPADTFKFMVIDPAGDSKDGKGDSWAIHVVAIEPKTDEVGASRIFIVDSFIEPMSEAMAVDVLSRMYLGNGMIMRVGYEKYMNTTPAWVTHFINALAQRGRHISEEAGTLVKLNHGSRNKVSRITSAIQWPLDNNKIFISNKVPSAYRQRLRDEMDKFPYWHDDGIDALSYVYDIIKDYRFQAYTAPKVKYKNMGVV